MRIFFLTFLIVFIGQIFSQTIITFSTPGTYSWTCPSSVTTVTIQCWGGGGGGGGANSTSNTGGILRSGGGGGGGGYASSILTLTPNYTYTYFVGSGGCGGNPSDGCQGNWSVFGNNLVKAIGGSGGIKGYDNTPSGIGGTGGNLASCIGQVRISGGNGASGVSSYGGGGGSSAGSNQTGVAGSTYFGGIAPLNGGNGGNGGSGGASSLPHNGYAGNQPGGGGGGGYINQVVNYSPMGKGGNGGNGQIVLAYYDCANYSTTVTATSNTICSGSSLVLTAIGTTSYSWNTGAITQSISISPSTTTTYTVSGITGSCVSTKTIDVVVYPLPNIAVNSGSICSGNTFTIIPTGASTFTFSGGSSLVSPSVTSSYSVIGTSAEGCLSSNVAVSSIVVNQIPLLLVNSNNAICGQSNGSATVSISGGLSPYQSQWSNGDFGLTADSLASGQYVFQVTDANGCYNSAVVNINNTNGPSISTSSITNVSCPGGNNGAISISATAGTTPYTYLWSNGATTNSINTLYAGVYDVTVTDATNCVVIQTYTVSQPAPLNLNFSSIAATCGANDGSLTANITGGTTPYTYLWSANAASQTTASAVNLAAGIYSCVVTDTKGCQTSGTGAVASASSGPILSFVTTNAGGCGNVNGGTIDLTVTGGSSFTYQWSNGATTQDISNLAPGNYMVVVTDNSNCSSTGSVTILNASGNTNPSVCIVTVDSLTGTNLLVWEKPATANGIKFYKIYREGSALGVYNLIHTQAFAALSEYVDITANPAVRGWRYKITYEDSCGKETVLSTHHKTIHLMVNKGLGNVMNLSWDQYEGFAYQTFYIWRRHSSTGWVQIDALPSNLFSYTDLIPPGTGTLRYMIEVGPTSGYVCNSSAKGITTTINTTKSNTKDNFVSIPTDIKEKDLADINLFPNPAKDVLHISSNNQFITSIKVYDITARLLSQLVLNHNEKTADISIKDFASGIYLAEIQTAKGIIRKQFVKE